MQSLSIPEILLFQWGMNLTRYTLLAGGAWLVFWKWFHPKWKSRRLAPVDPTAAQIRREILMSAVSMTIFLLPVAVILLTARSGYSKLYFKPEQYGWTWYFLSYVALFVWHDTYFYWTHRLMHWGPIYRVVHRVHHLSKHPTPFTAFSFHPLEALIEGAAISVLTFILPLHVGVTAIFTLFSLAFNVYGHLGIRVVPHRGFWKYFNSPESHGAHHERFRGNYSLYTNFWDRVMGTELKQRPSSTKSNPVADTEDAA